MDLPKKEKTFYFSAVGTTTGRKYEGTFTVLASLTIGQKHFIEIERTRLLNDYKNPTTALEGYALILSNLSIRVLESPDWWKQNSGMNIEDEDVLVALYDKVLAMEKEWSQEVLVMGQEAKEQAKTNS
jgi:hypothetical protein